MILKQNKWQLELDYDDFIGVVIKIEFLEEFLETLCSSSCSILILDYLSCFVKLLESVPNEIFAYDIIADFEFEKAIFMPSKFGNEVLVDRSGFVYRCNLKREARTYWRCRDSERFNCSARAVTIGFDVISWTGSHNHEKL